MPQSLEMTRQQLYDLVWSRSMGDAAASIPVPCARTSDTFDTFGTLPVPRRRRHAFRKIRKRQ
jgi:hypothetical protein